MSYVNSELRLNPITGAWSERAIVDEPHTIAELANLPGVYGFVLRDKPNPSPAEITIVTDDSSATAFTLITSGSPTAGQARVDADRGIVVCNIANNTDSVLVTYKGRGTNATIDALEGLASNPATAINNATAKTDPVDADLLGIVDSEDSNALKKVTLENLLKASNPLDVGDSLMKPLKTRSASWPYLYWHEADQTISDANAPDWVTYARAYRYGYNNAGTIEFNLVGSNWAVSSNVATLTFTDTTKNNEMLAGLSENFLKFGGTWADFAMVLNVPAVGNIAAGDKVITGLTLSTRQITFAETAADGSGAATFDAEIYPHRIAGSSTTAKWRQRKGVAYSPGDGIIAGAGHRDRDQKVVGTIEGGRAGVSIAQFFTNVSGVFARTGTAVGQNMQISADTARPPDATFDNSTVIRTGNTSRATGEGVYIADYLGVWTP